MEVKSVKRNINPLILPRAVPVLSLRTGVAMLGWELDTLIVENDYPGDAVL